jgi:HK97 family phage portal protein
MTDLLTRIADRARKNYSPLYDQHPELAERMPIMRVYSDQQGAEGAVNFPANSVEYGRSTWVHKAIKVIADNVSPHPLEVVTGSGDEREVLDNHPLREILETPNDSMSSSDVWRQWTTDMMLGGEEGFEIVRGDTTDRIMEIWPRQPHVFTVKPGKGGARYRRVAKYYIDDGQGAPYSLRPEEFLHIKFYNPVNVWRGIAPITAIRMGLVIDQMAQAWSRYFFRNSARPDYAILTDEGMTSKEAQELEVRLSTDYGRPEGWHKPIVLDQAVKDVKVLSFAPKDLEWIEQRKLSRDEVGGIFGVPDEIMGYGKDTYENFPTAFRVMWIVTIDPLLHFRDVQLTTWLRRYGFLAFNERIETNRSHIPELPEDLAKKITMVEQLFRSSIPINAINDRLHLGLPDLVNGDVGYVPIGMMPATSLEGRGSLSFSDPDNGDKGELIEWSYGRGAPPYGSVQHKELLKRREVPMSPLKDEMRRKLRKFFQSQQTRLLRALRASRELGRGKFREGKDEDLLPPLNDIFDLDDEIARFEEQFGPIITEAVRLSGITEIEFLGLDIAFDITRPEVQGEIAGILGTVANKTGNRIWDDLIDLFEEAEAEGEGIIAIQERLNVFYDGVKSFYQTERIARTTMVGATNAGATEAWDQSGVVKGREWVSALIPGRTRIEHELAHGQPRGLREAFEVGSDLLMYPGDPNGSVGNIVNCLCTTAPVLMTEEEE